MANYNLGEARGKIVIETDFSGLKDGQKAIDNATQNADKAAQSQQQAWGKVGTTAMVAGGSIVAAFAVGVAAASNFEFGLSAIQAVSGATAAEMDQISEAALRIGKDTAYSATEAASAMEELVKAGISVDDVLNGAADATVALAAAGGVDLPTAATIAANAMNQFNLGAEDMVGIVDKIAGAANASAIDVGEFGMSMSQVGAVAQLAGLSFEDTSLAIAAMGNAGIKGSDAGTSLKSMLMNLQPTTEKAATTMQELGLMTEEGTNLFYDQEGSLKSLNDISALLASGLDGLSEAQKTAALEAIFGSDAIRAAAIVADTGAEGFTELAAAMDKTSAAEVAATRMDNMKGSTEALMGSLETLWITVGQQIIPAIRDMVDQISGAIDWYLQLDQGLRNNIQSFALFAGGALLAFGAIIKIVQGLQTARGVILAMTGATGLLTAATTAQGVAQGKSLAQQVASTAVLVATKAAQIATAAATGIATAAQWAWNAAMTANPIGLIIAAVVALVAAIVWFFTQTELGQQIWSNFMTFLQEAWTNIASFFTTVWEGIVSVATTVWNGIMDVIGAVVTWFQTYVWPVIQFVIDMIVGYYTMLFLIISTIWNGIMTVIGAVVAWMMEHVWPVIQSVINFIVALFNFFWGVVQLVWQAIWDFLVTVVTAIVDFVIAYFTFWYNTISGILTAIWDFIVSVWNAIWGFLQPIIQGIVDFIVSVFTNVWNFIQQVFNNVRNFIQTVWNAIKSVVTTVVQAVWSVISGTWNGIVGFVTGVFNNVKSAITKPIQDALNFIGTIKDQIIGFFSGAGDWLFNAGKSIIEGFINGLENMLGAVGDFFDGLTSWIPEIKGPPEKDKVLLTENGRLIMQSLANGLASEMGTVYSVLNGMNAGIPAHIQQTVDAQVRTNSGKDRPTIELNLEYHAAPGDGTKTKEDVMAMLGHATELVREEIG